MPEAEAAEQARKNANRAIEVTIEAAIVAEAKRAQQNKNEKANRAIE